MVNRHQPALRSEFTVWRRVTTRWTDNDAYAHVNNAVFYQWFDTAVNSWLVEQGILDIGLGDPIAVVARTCCSYFAPLAFPQEVDIGLKVARLGRSSVCYKIAVFAAGAASAAAHGEFVHVIVDRSARTPVDIPQNWRSRLEAIS